MSHNEHLRLCLDRGVVGVGGLRICLSRFVAGRVPETAE